MAVDPLVDDPTEERRDGPTPAGGTSSVIYYRAANGDPAPKSRAVRAEVLEFDAAGVVIARTYGHLSPDASRPA
jgi:hypothetical protein